MSGTIGSHGIPGRAVRCAPRYAPALLLAILLCLSAALAACGGESPVQDGAGTDADQGDSRRDDGDQDDAATDDDQSDSRRNDGARDDAAPDDDRGNSARDGGDRDDAAPDDDRGNSTRDDGDRDDAATDDHQGDSRRDDAGTDDDQGDGGRDAGRASADPFFQSVSAGWVHTCGVMENGSLACWGDDGYGPSHVARRSLPLRQRRDLPHLRGAGGRLRHLLGPR